MAYEPRHMKWWGWGNEDTEFHSQNHPGFWPFAKMALGIEGDHWSRCEWKLDALQIPEALVDERFTANIRSFLSPDQISNSAKERVIHAYGKGFRDLFRLRRGEIAGAPDLIIYPESERDVCLTIRAASERNVTIIPFGGGSNRSEEHTSELQSP